MRGSDMRLRLGTWVICHLPGAGETSAAGAWHEMQSAAMVDDERVTELYRRHALACTAARADRPGRRPVEAG